MAPLLPALPAGAALNGAYWLTHESEMISPRSLALRKLAFLGLLLVAFSGYLAVSPGSTVVLSRNSGFLLGWGLVLARAVPRSWALLTHSMTPATMWLVGTQPPGVPPASWAILVHEGESVGAAVTSWLVLAIGVVGLFHWRPEGRR